MKADKTRQLTIEQQNAIDLLLQGKSDREVAEAVGVSHQTVTEWRNNNAVFVAELNRRRQETWGSQIERLRQLVAQAVSVLEEGLQQKQDLRLRQAAAVHILRAIGLYGVNLAPKGATDPEGIEAEWASTKALAESLKELSRLTA
ncbi:MAG: helix-turn-helix domain-containing protein [Firmicutes bacterium]|nr:helix-turn-helix domain-containing protein [Bacillota bacterium]